MNTPGGLHTHSDLTFSDLASPLSAIASILPPSLTSDVPVLAALSLQAAAKIFSTYAASISSSWSADLHAECKNVVASIRSGIEPFLSSPDIEVQERAFELNQLLSFVNADLTNHAPPTKSRDEENIPGMDGGFESDSKEDGEPPYPKSLFLFKPLFSSHELNTVAYMAQQAVPIPEGLNLDMDIVPNGGFGAGLDDEEAESGEENRDLDLGTGGGASMEELRRILRSQGMEGKDKKKSRKEGPLTAEEKVEKARVGVDIFAVLTFSEKRLEKRSSRRTHTISSTRPKKTMWTIFQSCDWMMMSSLLVGLDVTELTGRTIFDIKSEDEEEEGGGSTTRVRPRWRDAGRCGRRSRCANICSNRFSSCGSPSTNNNCS